MKFLFFVALIICGVWADNLCDQLLDVERARALLASGSSVARLWSDTLLCAIRRDYAKPVVHARNLYHTSAAMFDAYAGYAAGPVGLFSTLKGRGDPPFLEEIQRTAISFAAFAVLNHRFQARLARETASVMSLIRSVLSAVGHAEDPVIAMTTQAVFDEGKRWLDQDQEPQPTADQLVNVGGDVDALRSVWLTAARRWGLRCGHAVIQANLDDGANEADSYEYPPGFYLERNPPLAVLDGPADPKLNHPDHWQRLTLTSFADQSGSRLAEYPPFLGPHWGSVTPFALNQSDRSVAAGLYFDPGPPPSLLNNDTRPFYIGNFTQVLEFAAQLDPSDGVQWDISPASRGQSELGKNNGQGRIINPITRRPYKPQWRPRGDYTRVLAEFWADGPDSETPPGHWFSLLHTVMDSPGFRRRWNGRGLEMSPLDWDVRAFLVLGGALHDSAIAAWGAKGFYDFVRPVSAIRQMFWEGQSTDSRLPDFSPFGIRLVEGLIETPSSETFVEGGRHHEAAAAYSWAETAEDFQRIRLLKSWRGSDGFQNPLLSSWPVDDNGPLPAFGVGWLSNALNWLPYQRPSFVTPPFAGYVSGHSTFSRAAADTIAWLTGSHFWPGGMGTFDVVENQFLVFEAGPAKSLTLQWSSFRDAADETALSRIWGGIHPPCDDLPGRRMGAAVSLRARERAVRLVGLASKQRARIRVVLEHSDGTPTGALYRRTELVAEQAVALVNASVGAVDSEWSILQFWNKIDLCLTCCGPNPMPNDNCLLRTRQSWAETRLDTKVGPVCCLLKVLPLIGLPCLMVFRVVPIGGSTCCFIGTATMVEQP